MSREPEGSGRGEALLDVNVLVALAWPSHVGHAAAHRWFRTNAAAGWATTPVTESGFVRVSSNRRAMPLTTTPAGAVEALRAMTRRPGHAFWADDIQLVAGEDLMGRLRGHSQVTDAHLLALALARKGRLVTMDAGIRAVHDSDAVVVIEIED